MLTKLTIRNFKRFDAIEVELGNPVVFIGLNNSGKTSALQALALWDVGLRRWNEKRKGKATPERRPGVTVNRRDLIAVPVLDANLLWRDLHVRDVQRSDGKPETSNVRIEIVVEGVTEDASWTCGLEFDYANDESLYCRPLRASEGQGPARLLIPEQAGKVQIAFLPPMSGLAANETRLDPGAINVRVGEGRTAEVLRNLCYRTFDEDRKNWDNLNRYIRSLFGAELEPPQYIAERGEIVMAYVERDVRLDLSSSGRGLQQTLLLLAYMYANPGAVLLLDEPDAHLEILRQRQIYQLLTDVARTNGNQIIAASHSEVILNEAAERDVVVAFVGKPHRMNDRRSQVLKSLRDIGFEDYYLAEETGWVLYLEGSTDLAILRAFAEMIRHEGAVLALEKPFVHYVGNQVPEVAKHFHGLREAVPRLTGVALFDNRDIPLPADLGVEASMWRRREIENYLCYRETLEAFALTTTEQLDLPGPLFSQAEREARLTAMRAAIGEIEGALETLGKGSPWSPTAKVSDDFLTPVFENYFRRLGLPNIMLKKNFHELARFVPRERLDPEVKEKLDMIVRATNAARPRVE